MWLFVCVCGFCYLSLSGQVGDELSPANEWATAMLMLLPLLPLPLPLLLSRSKDPPPAPLGGTCSLISSTTSKNQQTKARCAPSV